MSNSGNSFSITDIVIVVLGVVLLFVPGGRFLLKLFGAVLIWYGGKNLLAAREASKASKREDAPFQRDSGFRKEHKDDDEGITIVSEAKEVDYTKE